MLLLERFREWQRTRNMRNRKRVIHTMEPHSMERLILSLTVLLENDIVTRGKVQLTRPHLKDINDALTFHRNEMDKVITLGERPRELPEELKGNMNETEVVWLDKFYLFHYKEAKVGIEETIQLLGQLILLRGDLSDGMKERFDYRIRKILKQLEPIVEHYIQLK